ncbi:hypothetical protein [Tabrizicola sp. YIM 78059]|uniref:hypothetical protein n=1 Tax=Tabrizicola sp. YIM 78059 TaxID=2529861 RepID=UPI0010AA178B|nr:hypothetical protein [Tabrizicola sp. YIM 78059]
MSGRLLLALAIAAIGAAVVGGFLIVGGPVQGQRDKFDRQRYLELGRLARALLCEQGFRTPGSALPAELTVEALRVHCSSAGISGEDLTDDETGKPYTYARKDDHDFSVCATFHDAARTHRLNDDGWFGALFDPETGCAYGWFR